MRLKLSSQSKRARVHNGHPWVFANELESMPPDSMNGQGFGLEDSRGRFLGMGIVNTKSQIVWRKYSRNAVEWNRDFLASQLEKADFNRDPEDFRRLVWSEADHLPGFIIDQFDDVIVVQTVTLGADRLLEDMLELLEIRFQPREILIRNDAPSRNLEGMERWIKTRSGNPLKPFWAEIHGIWFELDLENAQKTGFYLDQRQEHFKVATMAQDWRVLDAFSNQGAFALHCAVGGAREVIALESSGDAIVQGKRNAEKNEVSVNFVECNVFDWFTENREEKFDLIILDPPSFARNKKSLPNALKGYRELHLRALRALTPGGILASYCCSHNVDRLAFLSTLERAACDAGRDVQIIQETGQSLDHPVLLNFPESHYLKGFVIRAND